MIVVVNKDMEEMYLKQIRGLSKTLSGNNLPNLD